jgi:tetratricopeptide (TPR) repeat protein
MFEAIARFCPHCGAAMPLRSVRPESVPGITLEGRYRIEERSGADALSRVYKAIDLKTRAYGLVRVVHDHLAKIVTFAEDFAPRVLAVRPLQHPGILRTITAGRADVDGRAILYVVTESFEGRNLCSIVHGRGLLPPPQVAIIGIQVLECLSAAHKRGVLHLDLRPESIVIGAGTDGVIRPKIADFGLGSLAAESIHRVALGGTTLGTPLYSSPERLREEDVDQRSDIYSWGAVLYEQLTGTSVFEAGSAIEVERMHLEAEPESLRQRAPLRGIDAELDQIVLKALRKNPAERWQTAQEMAAALVMARGKEASTESLAVVAGSRRDSRMLPSTLHASISGISRRSFAVGREDIIEVVHAAALAPVEETRNGSVAILLGEAGMGKSAILDEVVASLWGGPLGIVRVEGRRSLHTPLEPFSEAARDLLGVRRGDTPARLQQVQTSLQERGGLSAEDATRLMDRLSGRASSLAVSLDVVEREEVCALRSFFGHVLATVPGLLVVEDADALDPASAALVLDLLDATASHPVSVLVTARGEPWPEWKASNAVRLQVGPLDERHARNLVRDRIGTGASAAADAIEHALKCARGSPMMLELFVQAMLAAGAERVSEVAGVGACESPRSLVELVLSSMSPQARGWLQAAALIGGRAPIALLQDWSPPPGSRPELLRAVAASNLARAEEDYLALRNEGVRDLIAELVAEPDRKQIHLFAARWFAAVHPARGAYEVIGAQFEAGGDLRAAAEHFENAARGLLDRGECRAAAALFKRATSAHQGAGDHDGALRVGVDHVEALLRSGEGKSANEALSKLERLGTVSAPGLWPRIFASVARAQGELDIALKALLRAAESTEEKLDDLARFEVETDTAELLQEMGKGSDAQEHAERAQAVALGIFATHTGLNLAEDNLRISQSASFLARLLAAAGRFADAREALQKALEHPSSRGDEASASRIHANLAFVASCENQPELATQHAAQALLLAQSAGDREAAARVAVNLAAYQIRVGDLPAAARTLVIAKSLSRLTGWRRGVELATEALKQIKN